MRYIDTSVLLAFLIPEAGSAGAEALMTAAGDQLAIGTWSEVELMSALGVKLRTKQVSNREAHSAFDVFTRLVAPCLQKIQVRDADHLRAADLLKGWRTALRAGDSLHLAIASAHRATIFTFDQGMARAAATLGIAVRLLDNT
jgi:predicted nucleic acid-binding protein